MRQARRSSRLHPPVPPRPRLERLESRRLLSAVAPSDLEQYMIELINRARADPAGEASRFGIALNEGVPSSDTISTAPKQPLAVNPNITDAARTHSQWMIDNDVFSHTGAGGSDPGDRIAAAGYNFTGSWGWGENIAYRAQRPSTPPPVPTTAQEHEDLFVDDGYPDRGHRTDMLNSNFKEVGAGVVAGNFQNYNALMVTTDFAYVSGNSFLTGVAYTDLVTHDNFYTPGEGLGGVTITARRSSDNVTVGTATTYSSGGYSLRLPAGTYNITATGGGLSSAIAYNSVTIGSQNVKRDFVPSAASPSPTPTPTPTPSPTPSPTPTPTPSPTPSPTPTPTPSPTPTPTPSPTPTPGPTPTPTPIPRVPFNGTIKGMVFDDRNADGKKNRGDAAFASQTVFLDANSNGVLDTGETTATTLPNGSYTFTGVDVGFYRVSIAAPDGWHATTAGHYDVNIGRKPTAKVKPMGITNRGTLTGQAFLDANADSVREEGEAGLRKLKVYLDLNGDGLLTKGEPSTKTSAAGGFTFRAVPPGTISVRVVLPKTGYQLTTPADGPFVVTLSPGGTDASSLFGLTRIA